MFLTPENLCAFAAQVRRSLIQSEVTRTRVLLHRIKSTATTRCGAIRSQSTEVHAPRSSSRPEVIKASLDVQGSYSPPHRSKIPTFEDVDSQPFPKTCPGCGAFSQSTNHTEAGYYSRSRKAVKQYLRQQSAVSTKEVGSTDVNAGQEDILNIEQLSGITEQLEDDVVSSQSASIHLEAPVCDRCHDLIYNNKGQSIVHPTVQALADSIAESPFKRNHVYHVLDAADFPMSLISNVFKTLELARPRSQNRRAMTKFTSRPTVSFIITRSDLLGPSKQMVDKMMPYFQSVLRSALGRHGTNIRLGNVHLVSAKRGWWTKEIKDSIWERGGGNWMVGKVNVGKSNLFPVLFPKGSGERAPVYAELREQTDAVNPEAEAQTERDTYLQEDSLLPPTQPEVPFPVMPIVSPLPGTTASPIRLPFGRHRGELIDLPGLERGNLEQYVLPDHRSDLVMEHRPNVKQYVIKPGQSLLLGGGLVRFTPQLDMRDPSTTMLAYPFVPIDVHVTATEKAIEIQSQKRETGIKSILAERAGANMKSGGNFALTTDVTKVRARALIHAGVPVSKLPFRVFSSDILVEGVGWVEFVCQVPRRSMPATSKLNMGILPENRKTTPEQNEHEASEVTFARDEISEIELEFKPFSEQTPMAANAPEADQDGFNIPQIEVFSPGGKHLSQRRPLGAWELWDTGREGQQKPASARRPRKPMKGAKKLAKVKTRMKLSATRPL